MSTDSTQIGNIIRSARHSKGLTQEELGDMIGVTKATINKYESGTVTNYARPRIEALSKALDISPLVFLRSDKTTPEFELEKVETKDGVTTAVLRVKGDGSISSVRRAKIIAHDTPSPVVVKSLKRKIESPEARALNAIYKKLPVRSRNKLLNYAYELLDESTQQ